MMFRVSGTAGPWQVELTMPCWVPAQPEHTGVAFRVKSARVVCNKFNWISLVAWVESIQILEFKFDFKLRLRCRPTGPRRRRRGGEAGATVAAPSQATVAAPSQPGPCHDSESRLFNLNLIWKFWASAWVWFGVCQLPGSDSAVTQSATWTSWKYSRIENVVFHLSFILGISSLGSLTFATKTDDEPTRSAAAEWRSAAMAESMRYETFVISARDSSHKYTPQGANCRTFYANVRSWLTSLPVPRARRRELWRWFGQWPTRTVTKWSGPDTTSQRPELCCPAASMIGRRFAAAL